jgi:SAM-dependent methyltransferase
VVEALADAVPAVDHAPPIHVAVDGLDDPATRALADDLDRRLSERGRRCRRVTLDALSLLHPAGPGVERPAHRAGPGDDLAVVDGCFLQHPEFLGAWDLVVFLRSDPPGPPGPYGDPDRAPAAARYLTQVDPEGTADVVVDLHDPGWPVIRRMSPLLADRLGPEVFRAETRAFFAPRAATWEQRFPDDDPAYAAAVAEVGLHPGQTTLDAGCGTGRALPHLRAAVGPAGRVLGLDLTPEMLATARAHGRHAHALLALADARRLPLPTGGVDGAFAAGPAAPPPRPRARPGRAGPGGPSRWPPGPVPPQRPGRPGRPPRPASTRRRPAGPQAAPPAPGPHGLAVDPLRRRPRPVPHHRRANLPMTLPRRHAVDVWLAELRRPDRAQGRRHRSNLEFLRQDKLLEAPAEVAVGIL